MNAIDDKKKKKIQTQWVLKEKRLIVCGSIDASSVCVVDGNGRGDGLTRTISFMRDSSKHTFSAWYSYKIHSSLRNVKDANTRTENTMQGDNENNNNNLISKYKVLCASNICSHLPWLTLTSYLGICGKRAVVESPTLCGSM